MGRFLKKMAILILLIYVCDMVIGMLAEKKMNSIINKKIVNRATFIDKKVTAELIVLGSSRAAHHYDTKMMSDSFSISCFNCGKDGSGIAYGYGLLSLLKKRSNPQIIIYDLTPYRDYYKGIDIHDDLGMLKDEYRNDSDIKSLFKYIDWLEYVKMNSRIYQYNARFFQIFLSDYISIDTSYIATNGYEPLNESFTYKNIPPIPSCEVDTFKCTLLKDFIRIAYPAKVVFVVSPYYEGIASHMIEPIRDLCINNDVTFIDYSDDIRFYHNKSYFSDQGHLNSTGATVFTRDLIKKMKSMCFKIQ